MQTDTFKDDPLELETKKSVMLGISKAAEEAFAHHELIRLDNRVWACAEPDTVFYSFYVAELPCAIALWGDIGSLMVDAGKAYNIDWLCGAIKSPYYILEKCSLAKQTYFYSGEFRQYLTRLSDHDVLMGSDWSESAFMEYRSKTGDCDSADVVYGYDRTSLWTYNALKKFVALLTKS